MIGDIFEAAAPIAAGYMFPGFGTSFGLGSGIGAGIATGVGIAALRGDDILSGGVFGGLGGYGGGSLADAAKAAKATAQGSLTDAAANKMVQEQSLRQAGQPITSGLTGSTGEIGANLGQVNYGKGLTSTAGGGSGLTGGTINQAYRPEFMATTSANMPVREATFGTDYGIGDIAKNLGDGNKAMGYGKMGLTGLGVASSAFKPEYPSPEDDPMAKYDPKRRLNLNMDTGISNALKKDTGLRLVKEGGHIKELANGGIAGLGGEVGPPPEYGVIDVGGDFVKTSDKPGEGLISKTEFYDRFKFKAPGSTSAQQNQQGGGGDSMQPSSGDKADETGVKPGAIAALAKGFAQQQMNPPTKEQTLGLQNLESGGYLETGGEVGDGMSDEIPATIEDTQEARLSDGEFVIPADVVSHLGNGSSDAGAKRLYEMMDKVRMARTGTKKQGKEINPEKYMPI